MNLAEIRKKARQEKNGESQPSESASTLAPDSLHTAGTVEQGTLEVFEEEIFSEPSSGEAAESLLPLEIQDEVAETFDPVAQILAGRQSAGLASAAIDNQQQESTENAGNFLKYLRFRVADEEYGVSLLEIREIIKPRDITEVPGMPDFVAGVLSLRGIIIPVFNLRLRLGLVRDTIPGCERIIIVRRQEGLFGLLVDEVYQVINLSTLSIEGAPTVLEGIDREFVSGIGRHGKRMLILLDLEKVLDISLC
ncbi:MAG: purine-binding chemotaxis protein CheW [Geobacter sp.]|nr:MAG: purine-binding chemotaxis protein CheW [Geobacter sp.]